MEDLKSLKVSELKKIISDSGLTFEDCVEKSDLIRRAEEARQKGPKKTAITLKVDSLPPLKSHESTIIFLHGLGDTS